MLSSNIQENSGHFVLIVFSLAALQIVAFRDLKRDICVQKLA